MARTKVTLTEKVEAVLLMQEALTSQTESCLVTFGRYHDGGWTASLVRLEGVEPVEVLASRSGLTVEAALAGLTDEMVKKLDEQRRLVTSHLDAALEKSSRALKAAKTLLLSGIDEEEADSAQ
jgi:hypothetical protein